MHRVVEVGWRWFQQAVLVVVVGAFGVGSGVAPADAIDSVDSSLLEIPGVEIQKSSLGETLRNLCAAGSAPFDCNSLKSDFKVKDDADLECLRKILNGKTCERTGGRSVQVESLDRLPMSPRSLAGIESTTGLEEKVVEGLTTFIATRAQAEAALYLRDELHDELCGENIDDPRRSFFPNLCIALGDVTASLSLQAMGTMLKTAAKADLPNLPEALAYWVAQNDFKKPTISRPIHEAHAVVRIAMAFARAVDAGRQPGEVARGISELAPFACETWMDRAHPHCQAPGILRQASYFYRSASLVSGDNPLGRNVDGYDLGAALLLFDEFVGRTQGVHLNADQFNKLFAPAKQAFDVVAATVKLKNDLAKIDQDVALKLLDDKTAALRRVRLVVGVATTELRSIASFARAIADARQNSLEGTVAASSIVNELSQLAEAIIEGDSAKIALRALSLARTAAAFKEGAKEAIPQGIERFVPLVVEVANAESSQGVAAALEAAAAPVGSYRQKYDRRMISITGLFGVGGGWEKNETKDHTRDGTSTGLIAPIGIHFTNNFSCRSLPEKWRDYHIGGLLSVIDVGNLASYQLSGGADKSAPKYGFKQILSPGAYLTLGLRRTPFVIGVGGSYSDGVRQIDNKDATSVRIQGFIALDLTLFPF